MSLKRLLPGSWLDDVGVKHGLYRFDNEDHSSYRRRILDHLRHLPEPTEKSYLRTLNRTVGLEIKQLLEISLKTEWDSVLEENILVVNDPHIEIDSSFIRVWSDYVGGKDPDLELNIVERDKAYFLKDVFSALEALDYLEIKSLVNLDDWKYKRSSHLMYGDSRGYRTHHRLLNTRVNLLTDKYIVDIDFMNTLTFDSEITSSGVEEDNTLEITSLLEEDGDYHVDYVDGIVFNILPAAGTCSYRYRKFPYTLGWHPVRAYPFNDKSVDYLIKDDLLNEDGVKEKLLLNSYGAKMVNRILAIHPLQWGK